MQIRRALVWSVTLVALAVTGGCSGDDSDASNAELRIAIVRRAAVARSRPSPTTPSRATSSST